MEKYIAGKRSMECKQKLLGGLVRNKIKHRKKYKIGKSPTPLGKITIPETLKVDNLTNLNETNNSPVIPETLKVDNLTNLNE
jgi:hypothetical protein